MSIQRCIPLSIILYILITAGTDNVVWAAGTTRSRRKNGNPQSRSIRVMNKSGTRIDIFWIHPNTRELAPSHTEGDGVMFGGESGISSYIGHEFEVQEMPSKKTKKCLQKSKCRKAYFTVTTEEDQWITIQSDFNVSVEDSVSRATKKAKKALIGCVNITDIMELTECLSKEAKAVIDKEKDDIAFQATIRKSMGEQLSDYSCGSNAVSSDVSSSFISPILLRPVKVTTTPSIRNDTLNNELVQTLFESDYTSVTLYENILSGKECEDVYNNNATYSVSSTIQKKVGQILQHAGIVVTKPTLSPDNIANYIFKIESGPTKTPLQSDDHECELQPDGSCSATKVNDSTVDTTAYIVEKTSTDDTVYARVILTCVKSNIASETTTIETDVNVTNNTTATEDDDSLLYTPSGMMYFTKAGVRIVPTDRSAIVIKYDDVAADMVTILREVDPFLDQHITCPVTLANLTVATIIYNMNH